MNQGKPCQFFTQRIETQPCAKMGVSESLRSQAVATLHPKPYFRASNLVAIKKTMSRW